MLTCPSDVAKVRCRSHCETELNGAKAARAIITRKQKKQDLEEPRGLQHFAICLDRNFSVSAKKQKKQKKKDKQKSSIETNRTSKYL